MSEFDLTNEPEPRARQGSQPGLLIKDPDPRESTRTQLAQGLLLILAAILAAVFIFVGFGLLEREVLAQAIFPSVVGLAGTALGFYFGAQTATGGGSSG